MKATVDGTYMHCRGCVPGTLFTGGGCGPHVGRALACRPLHSALLGPSAHPLLALDLEVNFRLIVNEAL